MIPKIIHQTWKTPDLPPEFAESARTWQDQHPDWTYMFWTDADIDRFVQDHYPQLWPMFQRYWDQIQRVDAFRYMVLAHHGGIYADLDIHCLRPMDGFCADGGFLAPTDPVGFSNDLMAAAKGHPFFLHAVNRLPMAQRFWQHRFVPRHFRVLLTTGSMFLSNVARRWTGPAMPVLPRAAYGVASDVAGPVHIRHITGNTWHGWDSRALDWARRHLRLVFGISVTIIALCVVALT